MWIEYNRILEGNQWIHPDFALDGRTQEKYLSLTDNTLFLANTTVDDFTNYAGFNIVVIPDEDVSTKKRKFGLGTIISKQEFVNRLNDDEWAKIAECESIVDALDITVAEKSALKTGIKAWLLKLSLLETIDLNDPKVLNMGNIFVQYGFITADRLKEIL